MWQYLKYTENSLIIQVPCSHSNIFLWLTGGENVLWAGTDTKKAEDDKLLVFIENYSYYACTGITTDAQIRRNVHRLLSTSWIHLCMCTPFDLKILPLVFEALNSLAAAYIYEPALRSSGRDLLMVPKSERAFAVVELPIWRYQTKKSVSTFKVCVKAILRVLSK